MRCRAGLPGNGKFPSVLALRTSEGVRYLFGDHLGSTSVSADVSGGSVTKQLYKGWGEIRYASGSLPTKYQYTGQYSNMSDFGLMFYNARWFDPVLGRFSSADTIVPGTGNPAAWDRYAGMLNNPLRYRDPSGHNVCLEDGYCFNGKYSVENHLKKYGITLRGIWKDEYKWAVFFAVSAVGEMIDGIMRRNSPMMEFKRLYSYVEMEMGGCPECQGAGAYTHSAHHIEFYKENPFWRVTIGSDGKYQRSPDLALLLNRNEVVHELGHAFAKLFSGPNSPSSKSFPDSKYLTNEGFKEGSSYAGDLWRQHPDQGLGVEDDSIRHHEAFADMFLGYTFGQWAGDKMGQNRHQYMETNMAEWVK